MVGITVKWQFFWPLYWAGLIWEQRFGVFLLFLLQLFDQLCEFGDEVVLVDGKWFLSCIMPASFDFRPGLAHLR